MRTLSLFEAKTHLSRLVSEVESSGKGIAITRHGQVVARLEPATPIRAGNTADVLRQIMAHADLRAKLNPREAEPISWEEIKAEMEAELLEARLNLPE